MRRKNRLRMNRRCLPSRPRDRTARAEPGAERRFPLDFAPHAHLSRSQENVLVIFERKVAGLNEAALERFVVRARKAAGLKGQVNVLVTSSSTLRSLNRRFRSVNKATDVLSFPASSSLSDSGARMSLAGEVAISADFAHKNSFRFGHTAAAEIKILTLHGILHLAGFDHERDDGQMARKEVRLRRALRLPSALIERTRRQAAHQLPSPARSSSRTANPQARRTA